MAKSKLKFTIQTSEIIFLRKYALKQLLLPEGVCIISWILKIKAPFINYCLNNS